MTAQTVGEWIKVRRTLLGLSLLDEFTPCRRCGRTGPRP
jgi:hypothetical protein